MVGVNIKNWNVITGNWLALTPEWVVVNDENWVKSKKLLMQKFYYHSVRRRIVSRMGHSARTHPRRRAVGQILLLYHA